MYVVSLTRPEIPFRPNQCPNCKNYKDQQCTAYTEKRQLPFGTSTVIMEAVFKGESREPCPKCSNPIQAVQVPLLDKAVPNVKTASKKKWWEFWKSRSNLGSAPHSNQRLADPTHPAHKQLEQVARIIDQYIEVEDAGDRTAMKVSAPVGEMEKALSILNEAVALCPDDMDLLVAKAGTLYASAQPKSAEEVLDVVLSKAPDHFEAKMWKNHWETWSSAPRFPPWNERMSSLHPVMAMHLRLNHRVQVVRDGMQKALAIVTGVEGPPFDSRTQITVKWILSKTPYGPLVAYYVKVIEPSGEPSIQEAFLPIFKPTEFSPMEGYFLVQQLAFTPYCFVVLVSGNSVLLNRKIVFGQKTTQQIHEIVSQLATAQSYLPQHQAQSAVQWHMNNFDINRLNFE